MDDTIYVWCDGGVRGNGKKENVAGWAYVLKYKNQRKELYGSTVNSTNNKMELMACILALSILKKRDVPVIVTSDSLYLVNGVNIWSKNWIKNGWKTKEKKDVENKWLWVDLLQEVSTFNNIKFVHCKGHSDNQENNRCDELLNIGMDEFMK